MTTVGERDGKRESGRKRKRQGEKAREKERERRKAYRTRYAVVVDTPRNCGRVLSLSNTLEKSAGSTTVADYNFDIMNAAGSAKPAYKTTRLD